MSQIAWPLGLAFAYGSSYFATFAPQPLWRGLCFLGWTLMLVAYLELYAAPKEGSLLKVFKKYDSDMKIWLGIILLCSPWLSKLLNLYLLSRQ